MEAKSNEFPLDVDLSPQGLGTVRFRTTDQVLDFLDSELRYWRWISNAIQGLPNRNSVLQFYQNAWEKLNSDVGTIRGWLESGQYAQAAGYLATTFNAESNLPPHQSIRGHLVETARENSGDREALGVIAGLLRLRIDGDDPEQIRGVIVAHEFLEGTGRHARRSVQDGLAAALRSIQSLQARTEAAADQLDGRIATAARRQKKNVTRAVEASKKARTTFASEIAQVVAELREHTQERILGIEGSSRAAIESIQATE